MLINKPIRLMIFCYCCSIFFFQTIYAQERDNVLLVETKLWNSSGDTITGLLEYMNQYTIQFNITISDTVENSIKYYTPRDIAGFYFYSNGKKVIYHGIENPMYIGNVFLKLIYEGEYCVYQYLELDQRTSYLTFITHYFLWKEVWLEPEISVEFEKEALLKHFSKCPEIEYKIKIGEYGLKNLVQLIQEFEECDLTDDYEYFYE